MDLSPECYVDTSALIAFADRADSHHGTYRTLFSAPPPLVTSALVIVEGHAWFLRRYDSQRAIGFLTFTRSLKPLRVLPFGLDQLELVQPFVTKFADQPMTLADLHGLAIMKERRIKTCWSTDRHLGLTGARLVM